MNAVRAIVENHEHCTGCAACESICAVGAIRMCSDSDGFKRPKVDVHRCVDCGACCRACPTLRSDEPGVKCEVVYAARVRDRSLLYKSASGGVFSALARSVLGRGGAVYGCAYVGGELRAAHIRIDRLADVARLQGSKYVQSDVGLSFRQCKADLNRGLEVLFSGTPCQIAGLNCYLGKKYEKLLLAEVICHGAVSPFVFDKFTEELAERGASKVVDVSFKSKTRSWSKANLRVTYASGVVTEEPLYDNQYVWAFESRMSIRPSCFNCCAREGKSGSDLTMGDFWGVDKVCPEMFDDGGTSAVLVRSAAGRRAILSSDLILKEVKFEDVLIKNPNLLTFVEKRPYYNKRFFRLVKHHPISFCTDHAFLRPLCVRIVSRLARMLTWKRV